MSRVATFDFAFATPERRKGRKGKEKPAPPARIPRIAKTMALAIQMQQLIRDGVVKDQADLARLGGVTRARLTQIMNLLLLAPDIQEQLLFCEPHLVVQEVDGKRKFQYLAAQIGWQKQRKQWLTLTPFAASNKPRRGLVKRRWNRPAECRGLNG